MSIVSVIFDTASIYRAGFLVFLSMFGTMSNCVSLIYTKCNVILDFSSCVRRKYSKFSHLAQLLHLFLYISNFYRLVHIALGIKESDVLFQKNIPCISAQPISIHIYVGGYSTRDN